VAHGGQEGAFGPGSGFRLLLGLLQGGFGVLPRFQVVCQGAVRRRQLPIPVFQLLVGSG
jgi:hypothetical protein